MESINNIPPDAESAQLSYEISTQMKICKFCGGCGYTIEVEAECCGNYKDYGCCGIPNPIQVQVKCKCGNGYINPINHPK